MAAAPSPWTRLAGRFLGLPPPRARALRSFEWVPMSDGTRLATSLYRPDTSAPRSTLLARTVISPREPRRPLGLLARLLAEQGHRVVLQECRGLQRSEGRFEPFVHDGADGADTLEWLAAQPGADGPSLLFGFGYAAHAAWATLAAARRPVAGLVVGFGTRDPHAWLHRGGALELEHSLALALELASAEPEGVRSRSLERALEHRPVLEADRVAARHVDWLRAWLAHPDADAWWQARTPALPERPPESLLVGGWHHPTLPGLLRDHAALDRSATEQDSPRPRLLVGPWPSAEGRRERRRNGRFAREVARATLQHLERVCGDTARPGAPVRVFVGGAGWRDGEALPRGLPQRLYLAGDGRAPGGGRLAAQPPTADADADDFVYDPADALPSEGGASLARPGPLALELAEGRGDVLRYLGEPLLRDVELAGSARARLFVSSDASRTDFTARLARVDHEGVGHHLCDGIARVALGDGGATQIEIELAPACRRLRSGERLRLEISSSSFPRFDRHPNTADPPVAAEDADVRSARQRVHHDAAHPSSLDVPWLQASGARTEHALVGCENETGPTAHAVGPVVAPKDPV